MVCGGSRGRFNVLNEVEGKVSHFELRPEENS